MNIRDVLPMLQLPRPAIACVALVFCFGFVSNESYKDAKRAEAERYLPAPGNRTPCPDVNAQGQPYIGWFASQADGSNKPVRHTCVYASARVL